MRVLVTGGSGFLGSYVIDNLLGEGHEVVIYDRYRHRETGVDVCLGDVRDATAIDAAVAGCKGVIHLAGTLGTTETLDNPLPAFETNVLGSLNVFQACRRYTRPCSYITVGNYWMNNPYSISKTTGERLAWMFNKEHATKIAVVRALNAYGPRQKSAPVRKIIPNFILPALEGKELTVFGDGSQIMDMIYASDVADIMVRALTVDHNRYISEPKRDADNSPRFDAGTGHKTTVEQIANLVIKMVGKGKIRSVPMRAGEPERSTVLGDPETLRPLYDGKLPALISLEEGLERTIKYYRGKADVHDED